MASGITCGQAAEMTLPEFPGKTFPAKVVRTAGAIESDSRTLLVELEVDNRKDEILAGGYAQMCFTEAKIDAALTVPANAVMFRADGSLAAVVQQDSRIELRKVKLGRDFGQTIEIASGLSAEDRVVINPAESLESGSVVSLAEVKTAKGQ